MKFSRLGTIIVTTVCSILLSVSCGKSSGDDPDPGPDPVTDEEMFEFKGSVSRDTSWYGGSDMKLEFTTDCAWRVQTSEGSAWLSSDKTFGRKPEGKTDYTLSLTVKQNKSSKERKASVTIMYGTHSKAVKVTVVQSGMPVISTSSITEDMFFSTCCARTTTAVQQGFDFDPEDDMVFFSQVNSAYRNYISWRNRVRLTTSGDKATNSMTLMYFSHGNNIYIDKDSNGDRYVWIANHGSRSDDDGKYRNGQVMSRIKLKSGETLRSFDTEENYYFGTHNIHASFDPDNDRMALYSLSPEDDYNLSIYKLSDVLAAPEKTVTLKYEIVRGGMTSPDAEWRGKPVVRVHDCRDLKPLHSFRYKYTEYGRSWQTVCLSGNRVYFFLLYQKPKNGRSYQTVMDILDLDGNIIRQDVLFPFSDNINDLAKFGYSDNDTTYLENEVMLIKNGIAYFSFSTQNNKDEIRRPLVFNFALDSLE